jgi:glycosyltransferase involved in cell wall biosynthesis
MKILYFSQSYTVHDYNFLRKMGESQHKIFFLPLNIRNVFEDKRDLPLGIRKITWQKEKFPDSDYKKYLSAIPSFKDILVEIKPDLIHAGPVQTCGFITALSGFHPFLLMSWGSDILLETDRNPSLFRITKYTLGCSDWMLVDNGAVRRKVQSIIPYSDKRFIEFPWGVDISRFNNLRRASKIRALTGWDHNIIILSTRMWEPVYGILDLIEGFYLAYGKNRKLRLILLGDGSLARQVHEIIENNGLSEVILMPGVISHDNLPEYFGEADIYLSCSLCDGSSISLLEAMASGLPSIVTSNPGNLQWIQDGVNGWLVPLNDPSAVARAIEAVMNEKKSVLERFSRINKKIISEKADWNKNFSKLLKLYNDIEGEYV